jgi:hypothetical protein
MPAAISPIRILAFAVLLTLAARRILTRVILTSRISNRQSSCRTRSRIPFVYCSPA